MLPIRPPQHTISSVENGLQKVGMQVEGKPPEQHNILDRMKKHQVNGVSITVIDQGKIHWSKDYGDMKSEPTTQRLFQACSISKAVTAAIALALVEGRDIGGKHVKLDLDQDVNEILKEWKIPESKFTSGPQKITLRRLLSHTAGLSLNGFGGYSKSSTTIPSNIQLLEGSALFNIIPELKTPEDLARFSNSFVFIEKTSQLFFVTRDGKIEEKNIGDTTKFAQSISRLRENNNFVILTHDEAQNLIATGECSVEKSTAAHNERLESVSIPGSECRYSGGGTQVIQQLIEEVTGMKFSNVAREVLLDPLEMKASGYEIDLPERNPREVAHAYHRDGTPVEGGWLLYPQAAAAGLWTTSSDLARFVIEIQNAYHDTEQKIFSQETALQMLTPQEGGFYGLGPELNLKSGTKEFFHPGSNEGYNTYFVCFPETKQGAVIMTNSNHGTELIREILPSLAQTYQWPAEYHFSNKLKHPVELKETAALYKNYAGEFELKLQNDKIRIQIVHEGDKLYINLPFPTPNDKPQKFELTPESETSFFSAAANIEISFHEGNKLIKSGFGEARRISLDSTAQFAVLTGTTLKTLPNPAENKDKRPDELPEDKQAIKIQKEDVNENPHADPVDSSADRTHRKSLG